MLIIPKFGNEFMKLWMCNFQSKKVLQLPKIYLKIKAASIISLIMPYNHFISTKFQTFCSMILIQGKLPIPKLFMIINIYLVVLVALIFSYNVMWWKPSLCSHEWMKFAWVCGHRTQNQCDLITVWDFELIRAPYFLKSWKNNCFIKKISEIFKILKW
jgi:hypothetical protein